MRWRKSGAARSAPASARRRSAPTTSRKTGSPITGSTSRFTSCSTRSTAISTSSSRNSNRAIRRKNSKTRPQPTRRRTEHVARLAALVVSAARTLASAGLAADEARRDAALLARHQLGWTHAHWLSHSDDDAPAGFALPFDALIARRARREPVAQITGIREFYGREFKVTSDVLSPRPETEFVIEQALAWLTARGLRHTGASTIADVGTGSGCLAITLALEQPYG